MGRPKEDRATMSADMRLAARAFCYGNLSALYVETMSYDLMHINLFYRALSGEEMVEHWIVDLTKRLQGYGIKPGCHLTAGQLYNNRGQ